MKKMFKEIFPYFVTILAAFLNSYSIRAFINGSGLLTSGMSGVSLIISRYVGIIRYQTNLKDLLQNVEQMNFVNLLTSLIFFAINIPLVYLAFSKLGKRFAILSTVYIFANTFMIRLLPNSIMNFFELGNDGGLSNAIFGGVFSGLAISLTLNVGGSSAGMEILGTYYSRRKQVSIGKFLMVVNAAIITLGGIILAEWTPILYTLILVFVSGKTVDTLHRFTRKIVINIITENYEPITNEMTNKTKYSCTIWKSLGGFTKKEKYTIMTVVPESKVEQIVSLVKSLDPHCFITTFESTSVYGNFYIEPLK